MSKMFGYTKKGGQHWFKSDAYSDKEIESIKDPEGGVELSLPTAIPSPFARMDLVKTAFRNINKSTDTLKAKTTQGGDVIAGKNDEKLVSDTLDLAEILFNIDTYKDKISIIVWDKERELSKLKQGSPEHRRLGEALELYLDQDASTYNFDMANRLYLFEYDHKVIGCTSPATLFFTTANDLTHAQIKITKNDITFDNNYAPLYERDAEFQKYLYWLFKSSPILSQKLTVVSDYLDKNLKILDKKNHRLYEEINDLNVDNFKTEYDELDTGLTGNIIEVIGVPLRKRKKENIITSVQDSDFVIQSDKYQGELKPLVLQNNFSKALKYANGVWESAFKVPYFEHTPLLKRKLPELGIQYPYLTVSDFFEPYLIRLVYPINKDKFFDGNVDTEVGDDSKGFILPLKKQFFDYFNSDDLLSSLPNKPSIEMIQLPAQAVKILLKIPIKQAGEFITFERTYYQSRENQISKPDEANNKGIIIEHQFGITLFPFIKTNDPSIEAYYRVQLVDRDVAGILKNTDYDLKFFLNTSPDAVEIRKKKIRRTKNPTQLVAGSQYYVLNKEFDFIQIKNIMASGASGIIIPKWEPFTEGSETFSFAVDFGTTNTHIEYKIGNGSPKALDVTKNDTQIATLFDPKKTSADFNGTGAIEIREYITEEFVPRFLGSDSEYKFPFRTVISQSELLNFDIETFTLADFNIPFVYETKVMKNVTTNLKWAKKIKGNEKKINAFFEELIMLLRNKILLNGGKLTQTKFVWFYPSSMKPARRASLKNTWNRLFEKYFNPTNEGIDIPEAIAPFYYFKETGKLPGGSYKPVVCIDIGGGTSDIAVIQNDAPVLFTSFKFAANSIFGDGYNEFGAKQNGFITKYMEKYQSLFKQNSRTGFKSILENLIEENKSENIAAFLFSLENNSTIEDKSVFSYNELLSKDEDLKIIFVYFYAAIVFHIAELMKNKNIELPQHIIFSGTGSKALNIITPDFKILSDLSKHIFEKVYNSKFDSDGLTINTEQTMPKEVTCKGGLMATPNNLRIDVHKIKSILTCVDSYKNLTYAQLTEDTKGKIISYIKRFNAFFLDLNSEFSFSDYFSVSEKALDLFRKNINNRLKGYLEEGLKFNERLDGIQNDENEIEESLFFYPMIGTIYNLSSQLAKLTPISH